MAVHGLTVLSLRYTSVKKRKIICFSLSVRSLLGGPYRKTKHVENVMIMSCAVIVRKGTASVGFEKWPAIPRNAVLP